MIDDVWNLELVLRIKSIAKIGSWLTHGIVKHILPMLIQKSSAKTESLWNEKSSFKIKSRLTDGIDNKYQFAIDAWNQERKQSHRWRMELSVKIASLLTRNRQRKHRPYRPWNHNWNLSERWRMESRAWPVHQIDSKNRFMATAWNCYTHSATADQEIVSENWVIVEREIIFENRVAADGWNRHRILIHVWCMKLIEKRVIVDAWNR